MNKRFIFLLVILISIPNSYSYVVDYPIDCDDNNPNIYPGAKEICNDNIDNNCNVNNGYEFDTNPNTGVDKNDIECCNLLSASWSSVRVSAGTNITLTVIGTSGCNNKLVNFVIKEDDLFPNQDENVNVNPQNTNFKGSNALSSWIAEFQNDGFGNPEYYFTASTDLLSIISSSPMLEVTESIIECGDDNIDQGENCFSCPDDSGCFKSQTCLNVANDWDCVNLNEIGTCGNGKLELGETCVSCPSDLPVGFCSNFCNIDGKCGIGENCLCGECNGNQGSCIKGNMCNQQGVCEVDPNDGLCTNDQSARLDDPECCNIVNAYWKTKIATTNSLVNLIAEGNEYCENRSVSFKVYEDELIGNDNYAPPDPETKIFKDKKAESLWSVINVDDGLLQGNPEFYFIANSSISSKKSDLLDIIKCQENDKDCDGVLDDIDKCPDTPLEEINNVDEFGCAPGELSCVAEWDCTNALWSECNEEGYRTRDINKCIYEGNNLLCESKYKPLSRQACLIEEAFPVFTSSNLIITILIILSYYVVFRIRK